MQVYNKYNIFFIFLVTFFAFFSVEKASAYTVSGLVEFTYSDNEYKIGSTKYSQQYFNQHYSANISNYIWDPRFLTFNGGVAYNILSYAHASDVTFLGYNLATTFFPERMFSVDLFGTKNTTSYQNNGPLPAYDVVTTSYGGTVRLLLGSRIRNGNNSNNNNNNYVPSRGLLRFPLPDIRLTRIHTESDFLKIQETRDNTAVIIDYRISSQLDIFADGTREKFEIPLSGISYDTTTANARVDYRFSQGDFQLTSRMTDRTVNNILGYDYFYKTYDYGALLNFKEKNRLSQTYSYIITQTSSQTIDTDIQRALAQVRYRIMADLSLFGGIHYDLSDYTLKAKLSSPQQHTTITSASADAGTSYSTMHTPEFLGPFGLRTSYDFRIGSTRVETDQSPGQGSSAGRFYSNNVGIGLTSVGWKQDSASFDYTYFGRRDHSSLHANNMEQSYRLAFSSTRIPRTNISISGTYRVRDTSSNSINYFDPLQGNTDLQLRSKIYDAMVDYRAASFATLGAGANRSQTNSHYSYTLSTLPPSALNDVQDTFYARAYFGYAFTRSLSSSAELREELRRWQGINTKSHQASIALQYRIRSILLSLDYKWRLDDPENTEKIHMSSFYAKLSRPF